MPEPLPIDGLEADGSDALVAPAFAAQQMPLPHPMPDMMQKLQAAFATAAPQQEGPNRIPRPQAPVMSDAAPDEIRPGEQYAGLDDIFKRLHGKIREGVGFEPRSPEGAFELPPPGVKGTLRHLQQGRLLRDPESSAQRGGPTGGLMIKVPGELQPLADYEAGDLIPKSTAGSYTEVPRQPPVPMTKELSSTSGKLDKTLARGQRAARSEIEASRVTSEETRRAIADYEAATERRLQAARDAFARDQLGQEEARLREFMDSLSKKQRMRGYKDFGD